MKNMTKMALVLTSLVSVSAMAAAEPVALVCDNGTIEEKGDAMMQITFSENGVTISPYEGSLWIPAKNFAARDAHTIAIVGEEVLATYEGEEVKQTVDAILTQSQDEKTLSAAISIDKGPFTSYQMKCYHYEAAVSQK